MSEVTQAFRAALSRQGFTGQMEDDRGARQVAATDNSIYEVVPQAIVYPADGADVGRIVRAAGDGSGPLSLTARGGNTGTNGQSLNSGIVVDFSRHMNRILDLDPEAMTVTVEPGVVLDQLNSELLKHGLFFPPKVSTSSRATIGGMVATDASGKGSRLYGKTSDYVLSMDVVLSDGTEWHAQPMSRADAEALAATDGIVGDIHREVLGVVSDHAEAIEAAFPKMNRGLTGYNLQHTWDAEQDRFSLTHLLAGSEGTLALTKAVTLRVIPKPAAQALAVVRYDDFQAGLRDVRRLLDADPSAIEIIDDKVLGVAQTDIVWSGIEGILGSGDARPVRAINFIEFVAESQSDLEDHLARAEELLHASAPSKIDTTIVRDPGTMVALWTLREKSVGLLARIGGGRQGVPFVEDTAVPPENLPGYVAEFRALLDGYGLTYGMFGHADVGCLHVRPFLDMKDPDQARLIRPISDAVAELTRRHGGLLWGEHGRGFRGEYSPLFFGKALYPALERIKAAFDPRNLLNPGKVAAPPGSPALDRIDGVPMRGERDRRIPAALMEEFDRAVACNGNGACFSWDALDLMCPSYKATRDRAQSPKGRAALLRAWARLAPADGGADRADERREIEAALAASLSTCLSCKACTTLCPVKVDVPSMKSRFLARYFQTHPRPIFHHFLKGAERLFALGRTMPRLANRIAQSAIVVAMADRMFGLVDLPAFSTGPAGSLPPTVSFDQLRRRGPEENRRTVILIEDSFTASFDREVISAAGVVLRQLGYETFRLPARANGKLLHILGFRSKFARIARARVEEHAALAETGAQLVGLDAATALMSEQEYREAEPAAERIVGLEEFLAKEISGGRIGPAAPVATSPAYRLFGHCTESALRPTALLEWTKVLGHFGISADPVRTGCCGMAGLFGHEKRHLPMSRKLFDMPWRDALQTGPGEPLATGYSCRSQAKRFTGRRPRHPVEILHAAIIQRDSHVR